MKTADTIQKLIDETAVFSVLVQDVPEPYKNVINSKIQDINDYLAKILTIETESYNTEFQNYASDILTELESQQYENNQ